MKLAARRDRECFGAKARGAGAPPPPPGLPGGRRGGGGRGARGRGRGGGGKGRGFRPKLSIEALMKITRCRLCDEKGHWGDECPNPDRKKEGPQRRP
eukprot:9494810-Pyramimonas_sp.AAC.1